MIREMAIADILELPSVDSDCGLVAGPEWSTKTVMRYTSLGEPGSQIRIEYDTIMAEMEHDGYNRIPIHVDIGERMGPFYGVKIPLSMLSSLFMGNGHHRLAMMIQLGFTTARVTDDPAESDDTGDEMYSNGYDSINDDSFYD